MRDFAPQEFAIEPRERDELMNIAHLANLLLCPDTRPTVHMARIAAGSMSRENHDKARVLEQQKLDPHEEILQIYDLMWADIRERAASSREMVAGLVFSNRKMLMGLCTKYDDELWGPFGGKKEDHDATSEAAVVREHGEELDNAEIEVGERVGVFPTYSRGERQLDVETFACRFHGGQPTLKEPENFSDIGWFTVEEAQRMAKRNAVMPNMFPVLRGITDSRSGSHKVLHEYLDAS
jgi:8-oxo-dGTP pyrophosphatase MutT (NUDIX family)